MSKAIQKVAEEPKTLTLHTERAAEMSAALKEEKEIRILVRDYIADQMTKGTDFGPMPGVKARENEPEKSVLFKPGAEKLFDIFKCRPEYRVMAKTVDPVSGLYYFEFRCRAIHRDTGRVMNEGLGSASSYESKYRYRAGERTCPDCKKVGTIRKSATEWYCWRKLDGCGHTFDLTDKEITEQKVGKVQNPDLADSANTVLKMAKKRAQVDCAIGLARVSDLFTADLEDLPTIEVEVKAAPPPPAQRPPANEPPREPVVVPTEGLHPSHEQRAAARDLVEKAATATTIRTYSPQIVWERMMNLHNREVKRALEFMRETLADPKAEFSKLGQKELETLSMTLDDAEGKSVIPF